MNPTDFPPWSSPVAAAHDRRLSCCRFRSDVRASARPLGVRRLPCILEAPPIRMTTEVGGTKPHRKLATVRVFHQAFREVEGWPQTPGLTYFRVGKTPPIAGRFVGHGGPFFSNLRRSGWRQKTLPSQRAANSQLSGFSTRHSERLRACPRYLVRHIAGSGRRL